MDTCSTSSTTPNQVEADRVHQENSTTLQLSANTTMTNTAIDNTTIMNESKVSTKDHGIRFIFSDVDGTLVHYPSMENKHAVHTLPDTMKEEEKEKEEYHILDLPASTTGMRGQISSRTLQLCHKLQNEYGIYLILISGMRTKTLLQRLPFLPRAHAYVSECGGRIFYPISTPFPSSSSSSSSFLSSWRNITFPFVRPITIVHPQKYRGMNKKEEEEYGIVEDMEWKKKYIQKYVCASRQDDDDDDEQDDIAREEEDISDQPLQERKGDLWEFARFLETKKFHIDCVGYSTCFRINWKHQDPKFITRQQFDSLILEYQDMYTLYGLHYSINLGCIDFFPKTSGKKNCCAYLAKKLYIVEEMNSTVPQEQGTDRRMHMSGDDILSQHAYCLCDDDNDIEMAKACRKAFVPSISSASMAELILSKNYSIFTTENVAKAIVGCRATEEAFHLILEELKRNERHS